MPGLRDADGPRRRGRRPVRLRPRRRRRLRARRDPRRRERVRRRRLAGHRLQVRALGRARARRARARRAAPSTTSTASTRPGSSKREGAPMSRPSQRTLQQRLADGVVDRRRGLRLRARAPRLHQGRPVRARGDPRRARRAPAAAPRVPPRRLGRDGRADLLRAPRQAQGRRARRRPRGDEPPGGQDRERDRRRGRRARGRQHLQHLVLRPRATRTPRARWSARSTRSSSAGPSRRASTS